MTGLKRREAAELFDADSRTGRLMRARDWSSTALGPIDRWPDNLKTALRLMLASPTPTFIWWGRDLINLHNDACARLFGRRRPDSRSIGRPASEVRQELWKAIGTEVVDVIAANAAATVPERRLRVKRGGREQDIVCSFSLTPIRDDWGGAVGVLGACTDETASILARRRSAALGRLAAAARAETPGAACEHAAAVLAADAPGVRFALVYLEGGDGGPARLATSAGTLPPNVPQALALDGRDAPANDEVAEDAWRPFGGDAAVALPLAAVEGEPALGRLVVGFESRLADDEAHREFLAAAADVLAAAVAAAQARERRSNADAAVDTGEQRDEFLAMLAHELRNPLAPLRSAAELLTYVDGNPVTLAPAREIIERQLAQLVRLIDDLLDASRISRGKFELRRTRFDLRTAIASAVESARPLLDRSGHQLTIRMPEEPVEIHGDYARVSQAISNLLENAAEYTDDGGRVSLALDLDGDVAVVRVSDDGIGIEESMLSRIFELFAQGEHRGGEPRRGLGIGLTIARRVAELHRGTLTVKSAGKGRGSEFVLTLPRLDADASTSSRDTAARGSHAPRRRILVADDNRDAAAAMAEVLAINGHEVRTAADGLEATEVAESFRPDCILLDIGMPGVDGYEACRRIRRRPWARDIAIFAVTGWGQPSDRRRTREAGFNAHLVKPVSFAAIQELLAARAP
ncbi:MAG TPA: response regulator [Gammaproteobacteria bacterium]